MGCYWKYQARHWKIWLIAALLSMLLGAIMFPVCLIAISLAYWVNCFRANRVRIRIWRFSDVRNVLRECCYPEDIECEKYLMLKKNKGPWGEA